MAPEATPRDFGMNDRLPRTVGIIDRVTIRDSSKTVFRHSIKGDNASGIWSEYLKPDKPGQMGYIFADQHLYWTAGVGYGHPRFLEDLVPANKKPPAHVLVAVSRNTEKKPTILLMTSDRAMIETLGAAARYFQRSLPSEQVELLYQTPNQEIIQTCSLGDFTEQQLQ